VSWAGRRFDVDLHAGRRQRQHLHVGAGLVHIRQPPGANPFGLLPTGSTSAGAR
jgi:hypothetical protein